MKLPFKFTEKRKFDIFLIIITFILTIISGIIGGFFVHYFTQETHPFVTLSILGFNNSDLSIIDVEVNNLKEIPADTIQVRYKLKDIPLSGISFTIPALFKGEPKKIPIYKGTISSQIKDYLENLEEEREIHGLYNYDLFVDYYCKNCKIEDMKKNSKIISIECNIDCSKKQNFTCFVLCGSISYDP